MGSLSNRAAAALKLGRYWRALADTAAAAALGDGAESAKGAFRRAQALLGIGACALAVATATPHASKEPELRALVAKATERARATERCAIGFGLGGGESAEAARM